MDFEKNPLMNDTSRCRREVRRWLALVALTLAALLTGMVSASPESQEFVGLLTIVCAATTICAFFGIRQCSDHCRSVQYGLSVFEAMKKDLEGTEIDLEETRGRLYEAENELAQTQECLYRTENVLEETRDWVCETDDALVQTRNRLDETKDELASVKFELSKAKLKLRLKEVKAQHTERCYESLRKAYSEATLDLLKTRRERDTARRIAKKFIAKCNKLRYELTEAKIGFEWFLSLYYEAEERIRFAKQQIERLENAQSELEETQKSERDKLRSELNEAMKKADWLRREYFKVWRKTLRQSYNAKRQVVNLESILKNLDEATEIADLREKLKMVINRLSSEDSHE